MKKAFFLNVLLIGLLTACNSPTQTSKPNQKTVNTEDKIIGDTIFQYFKSGKLKAKKCTERSEQDTSQRRAHGLTTYYFENGKIKSEVNFKNGVKHGEVKTYFESGELYSIENFKNGALHGKKQKFTTTGVLMYEAYYSNGVHSKNTKLFDYQGKKITTPKLKFSHQDLRLQNGTVVIKIEVEPKKGVRKSVFHLTTKLPNGENLNAEINVKKGVGYHTLYISPRQQYISKIYITARCRMKSGEYVGVIDNYNLVLRPI